MKTIIIDSLIHHGFIIDLFFLQLYKGMIDRSKISISRLNNVI